MAKIVNYMAMVSDNERCEDRGMGIRAYFERDYGGRLPEHYAWLLADVVGHGKPGRVLDLGCGTGLFVELAAKWGIEVSGCDGSHDALAIAAERTAGLQLTWSLFSEDLPFRDESFDNIVLNQVIEHLREDILRNVLRECYRVLRNEGVVFIYSPSRRNRREVLQDETHVNPLYPSELREYLREARFKVVAEPNAPMVMRDIPFVNSIFRHIMKYCCVDLISGSANARATKA